MFDKRTKKYKQYKKIKRRVLLVLLLIVLSYFINQVLLIRQQDSTIQQVTNEYTSQKIKNEKIKERLKETELDRLRVEAELNAEREIAEWKKKNEKTSSITEISQPTSADKKYTDLIQKYDWNVDLVWAIMRAESGLNPSAVNMNDKHHNCTGSYGLMQIACFWADYYGYAVEDLKNPEVNILIANKIYERQGGFQAWGAYTNGSYKSHL